MHYIVDRCLKHHNYTNFIIFFIFFFGIHPIRYLILHNNEEKKFNANIQLIDLDLNSHKFELMIMMNNKKTQPEENLISKEDEIFKLLTHQTRRNIIKVLGERDLTFSQIKKKLEIDSPTLSYHLKSMSEFVVQKKSKYIFSEIGRAALFLLTKTDQSIRMSRYKRHFWYAHIITGICWVVAGIIIPTTILSIGLIELSEASINLIVWIIIIGINIISVINMSVIGLLKNRYA